MLYYVATRTRRQLLTYSICDTLEEASKAIKRYSHVWRIHIYSKDNLGNIKLVK